MLALLLPALAPILGRLAALIPDPEARAKAEAEATQQLMDALAHSDADQAAVNKVEAANGSIFVAGWRPAIGWTCAAALAYQYVAAPLATFGLSVAGADFPPLPRLDDGLWQLVTGMLGLGAMRSYEKVAGAETISIKPYENARGR
jgi:hypothetical protein